MNGPKLTTQKIRARRRPGVIAAVYVLRASIGLVFAWPLCEILARGSLAHPRGDAVLFDPGGLYLVEAFRLGHGAATAALRGLSPGALIVFSVGLLPLGALLHALGHGGTLRASDLAAAAVRLLARFSVLLAMATLAMAFALLSALALATATKEKIAAGLSDPAADLLVSGLWLAGAAVIALIGIVHDLARAAVAQMDLGATDAVRLALRAAAARPAAAVFGWAWRGAASASLVILAAVGAAKIGVERTPSLIAVGLLHQSAILAVVALRASWLACALRLAQATASGASLAASEGPEELLVATSRTIPADVESHHAAS